MFSNASSGTIGEQFRKTHANKATVVETVLLTPVIFAVVEGRRRSKRSFHQRG